MRNTVFRKALFASIIGSTLFAHSAHAAPVLGDYDGDGSSDLSVALVDRTTGITDWVARPTSGASSLSYRFTVPGDALVSGAFFNDLKTYPGVVYVRDASKPLEWHIKDPSGGEVLLNFCKPGDDIFNLADIDGDGKTDIACSRKSGRISGFRSWYFAVSSQPGVVAEEIFGLDSDRASMAYMDNSGRASMVALRAGFTWFTKKVWENTVTQKQWGLPGDIPLNPQDMNNSGNAAYVIVRPSKATGDQTAYILYPDNTFTTTRLGLNTAVPLIGKFTTENGFAWYQRNAGLVGVRQVNGSDSVFSFGTKSSIIVRPDGSVIQASDTATFGDSSNPNPGSGDGYQCTGTIKFPDGRGNTKVNAANSRHALKLILKSSLVGKITRVKAFIDGQFFDNFHSMGLEIGNRPWWNSDKKITAYSSNKPVTAVIYTNDGEQLCLYIKDPTVTVD